MWLNPLAGTGVYIRRSGVLCMRQQRIYTSFNRSIPWVLGSTAPQNMQMRIRRLACWMLDHGQPQTPSASLCCGPQAMQVVLTGQLHRPLSDRWMPSCYSVCCLQLVIAQLSLYWTTAQRSSRLGQMLLRKGRCCGVSVAAAVSLLLVLGTAGIAVKLWLAVNVLKGTDTAFRSK